MIRFNYELEEISERREGADVCEFVIESNTLARIVNRLIEDCGTKFDAENGRWLSVENDIVHGIACESAPSKLSFLIGSLDAAIYYALHDEDADDYVHYYDRWSGNGCYYKELEDNKEKIQNDLVSVKWIAVCTDLGVMDFGANIGCIDEDIFSDLMEEREDDEKETCNSLEEAMNDNDFINEAGEYLFEMEMELMSVKCFLYKDGKEEFHLEIQYK